MPSCCNQVPAVNQLSLLDGNGREQLRLSRTAISVGSKADFSRDFRFTETDSKSVSYASADFRDSRPFMSIAVSHSGFNAGVTVADIDLRFLIDFLGDAQVGKSTFAYVVDPHGAGAGEFEQGAGGRQSLLQPCRRSPPSMKAGGARMASGTDTDGHAVLTAANAVPKLGWFVLFEQPTAQALAPIRDQLVRVALLIALGLAVAILAGTLLARRMLIPITALRRGARRLGAGDFSHRIDVHTNDELEELAEQFNSMAGQLQETYSGLETKVEERTRDLAHSINELKVLEEVGRAVASSLDLNAVLPTVAARALEITHADAVLIYGYDADKASVQPCRGDRHRQGAPKASISRSTRTPACSARPRGKASRSRLRISLARRRPSAARRRGDRRLSFGAGGAAGRPDRAFWDRWWCCAAPPASSRPI